ncbi:hypothetical protein [Rhodococcus rhodochrous]|uniref:hypothetical protein n=1 Tax=Rhodococcus rhodochrous TaxID=1829 RepID=UPI00177F7330|nr:hypothetical protein [Rhodococcus rhodochrous]
MTYEQEKEHLINEILHHGRTMKMLGFNQAAESFHGIEKAETSTFATAQAYLQDKNRFEDQERARVEYAIERLVAISQTEAMKGE